MKVAVLNDYSMPEALRLAAIEAYPAHHTWGVSACSVFGIKVVMMPFFGHRLGFVRSAKLRALGQSLLGQLSLLFRQGQFDVLFAACQSETWLLARLRKLGLFRRPIVAVIHHPLRGRLRGGAGFVGGHDRMLFLSDRVCEQTRAAYPVHARRMASLPWGADIAFYDQLRPLSQRFGKGFFISAGKANRDHDALAQAADGLELQMLIVCSDNCRPHGKLPANVNVLSNPTGHALSYLELLSVYRESRAVVIPLVDVDALAGLTSLIDAMACGKPVIMTRNPYIDIDIEKLGFGVWVDVGDVVGMRQALDRLAGDDMLAERMGRQARACAEGEFSYHVFAERVAHCLADVGRLGRSGIAHG